MSAAERTTADADNSAVRVDYFYSRLLVDYFSYNTRITFQRCTYVA